MYSRCILVLVLSVFLILVGFAPLQAAEQDGGGPAPAKEQTQKKDGWTFILAPYASFVGMNGTVGADHKTAKLDLSYHQLAKDVQTAVSISGEAKKGNHSILLDVAYSKLGGDALLREEPTLVAVDATFEMTTIQATYAYRFLDTPNLSMEAMGGLRYWNLDGRFDLQLPVFGYDQRYSDVRWWIDPVIGIRAIPRFNEKLSFPIKLDIGGFGIGSRMTSKGSFAVNYRLLHNLGIQGGYGYTYVDYNHSGTVFNVTFSGPFVALEYIF